MIRTLDLGAEKFPQSMQEVIEATPNPALGLRSLRLTLHNLPLFKTQLRAILRAATSGDVRIMFPLVSTLLELRQAKMILGDVIEDLEDQKVAFNPKVKVGMMVEVPSAALMADEFAREVDFFSIGTNDLIQYTLAVDRANPAVANLYSSADPSVLRLIEGVVQAAEKYNLPVSVCGQMSSDPIYIPLLVGMGLRELSVTPQSILEVKQAVRNLTAGAGPGNPGPRRTLDVARDVESYLRGEMKKLSADLVYDSKPVRPGRRRLYDEALCKLTVVTGFRMPGLVLDCIPETRIPAKQPAAPRQRRAACNQFWFKQSALWRPPSLRSDASGSSGFRWERDVPENRLEDRRLFRLHTAVPSVEFSASACPGACQTDARACRPADRFGGRPHRLGMVTAIGPGRLSRSTGCLPSAAGQPARASAPFVIADEGRSMKKEMLVNALQPEESRIAIVENGVLEELYIERNSLENFVGNIYKGRVVNIEPSIQAAFVDFGVGRNGFLHVSDVEYQYYKHLPAPAGPLPPVPDDDDEEEDDRPQRGKKRFNERQRPQQTPHSGNLQTGQRSPRAGDQRGNRHQGADPFDLHQHSRPVPGARCPACSRVGVSRKITDEATRRQLRTALEQLNPPEGLGFIIRTAGIERSQKDLQRDLNYLLRLWKVIVRRIKKTRAPVDIYQESDMVIRTIRDIYNAEIETIWIDEPETFERAREFLKVVLPRHANRIQAVRRQRADFSQVPHRRRDHPHPAAACAAGRGRFARHRPDRGPGRHRRQQRQLPGRQRRRRDGLSDEPAGGGRNLPADPPARSGRGDRQRFHRHARRAAPARGRTGLARRDPPRPGPLEDPADQPVRPDRNDPPADPPVAPPQRLRRLPLLPRHGSGQDGRKRGDRGRAASAQLGPPRKRRKNHRRSA